MIKNLFSEPILKALSTDLKITEFTKIQEECIPIILKGKSLTAISETGSGKTLSFVLPLVEKILNTPKRPIKILIISPTKELTEQILSVIKIVCRHTPLLSMALYGGYSFDTQKKSLKNGVHILVACPGRLKDHIEKKTIDLSGIETLVLDEVDQLMDMGFSEAVTEILEATSNRSQTLLFSASINPEIEKLIADFLPESEKVKLHDIAPKQSILESFCPIEADLKYPFLRFLLKHKKIKSCIIFTQTKIEATELYNKLLEDKYPVALLQGDLTTHQRKKSLDALKLKSAKILVATDVASRGIDIPHVTHIINYSPPLTLESYVHRSGRTARHDKNGESITLYSPLAETDLLRKIEQNEKTRVPTKFKEFNYGLKLKKLPQSKKDSL